MSLKCAVQNKYILTNPFDMCYCKVHKHALQTYLAE